MIPLTVVSYNIHRGVGLDRRLDLDRITDVIDETAPDVIGLQEVIREAGAPHADQAAYVAAKLGMHLVMGATRAHGTGSYGNARRMVSGIDHHRLGRLSDHRAWCGSGGWSQAACRSGGSSGREASRHGSNLAGAGRPGW